MNSTNLFHQAFWVTKTWTVHTCFTRHSESQKHEQYTPVSPGILELLGSSHAECDDWSPVHSLEQAFKHDSLQQAFKHDSLQQAFKHDSLQQAFKHDSLQQAF